MAKTRTVPPVDCEPWCADQDGHPDCSHRDDQTCFSAEVHVPLSLYPSERWTDGVYRPEFVNVYAGHNRNDSVFGAPVKVHVGLGDALGFDLTLAEAEQVAAALQATIAAVTSASERDVKAPASG